MRLIRVVLDTNVIVSAHLNANGYERNVLDLILVDKLQLSASELILTEYEAVLRRAKFRIAPRHVTRSIGMLRKVARLVRPVHEFRVAQDPEDNRFLECAEKSRADFLVTGNKRHFPREWRQTRVVNARELLEWIVPELKR